MTNPIPELDNIVKDLNAAREILESVSVNVMWLRKQLDTKTETKANDIFVIGENTVEYRYSGTDNPFSRISDDEL